MNNELEDYDFILVCNGSLLYAGDDIAEAKEAAQKMLSGIRHYQNTSLWSSEIEQPTRLSRPQIGE